MALDEEDPLERGLTKAVIQMPYKRNAETQWPARHIAK